MRFSSFVDEFTDHGFDDISYERLLAMVNDTLWDVCAREPWPFLEAGITLTFDGSSATPTNWPSRVDTPTQVITVTGMGTTDHFKLTYNGVEGATVFTQSSNMTAAAIQAALRTACADTTLTVAGTTNTGQSSSIFTVSFGDVEAPLSLITATTISAGVGVTTAPRQTDGVRAVIKMKNIGTDLPIRYIRRDDWVDQYQNQSTTTGTPQMYYFVAGTVSFYPIPTSSLTVRMEYLKDPAPLSTGFAASDVILPLNFHRGVLANGALYKAYSMNDDGATSPAFETFFERNLSNMREQIWRKNYDQPQVIHPVDPDDLGLDYGFGNWMGSAS